MMSGWDDYCHYRDKLIAEDPEAKREYEKLGKGADFDKDWLLRVAGIAVTEDQIRKKLRKGWTPERILEDDEPPMERMRSVLRENEFYHEALAFGVRRMIQDGVLTTDQVVEYVPGIIQAPDKAS